MKSFTFTDPALFFIQRQWVCQGPPNSVGNVPASAKHGMQQSVVLLSYSSGTRNIHLNQSLQLFLSDEQINGIAGRTDT